MELKIKSYMQKLEHKMEDIMEESVTCRNAEMLSILVKAWHDIDSMIGHDDPRIKK